MHEQGEMCLCLLGTHIHDGTIATVQEVWPNAHIMLALDKDATAKALSWKTKIGYLFKNFTVVPLSKDIKDMTEDELLGLLTDVEEKTK
jgi:hypothetical protein